VNAITKVYNSYKENGIMIWERCLYLSFKM
jgi:hypothetical protein